MFVKTRHQNSKVVKVKNLSDKRFFSKLSSFKGTFTVVFSVVVFYFFFIF